MFGSASLLGGEFFLTGYELSLGFQMIKIHNWLSSERALILEELGFLPKFLYIPFESLLQSEAKVDSQLWVCQKQSLFYLLIIVVFSMWTTVNIFLPHPALANKRSKLNWRKMWRTSVLRKTSFPVIMLVSRNKDEILFSPGMELPLPHQLGLPYFATSVEVSPLLTVVILVSFPY